MERHKEERAEKERQREWHEQERLDREERERAQREAVQQHFEESLRLALQKVSLCILHYIVYWFYYVVCGFTSEQIKYSKISF